MWKIHTFFWEILLSWWDVWWLRMIYMIVWLSFNKYIIMWSIYIHVSMTALKTPRFHGILVISVSVANYVELYTPLAMGLSDRSPILFRSIAHMQPLELPIMRSFWHYASATWEDTRTYFYDFQWNAYCFQCCDLSFCAQRIASAFPTISLLTKPRTLVQSS